MCWLPLFGLWKRFLQPWRSLSASSLKTKHMNKGEKFKPISLVTPICGGSWLIFMDVLRQLSSYNINPLWKELMLVNSCWIDLNGIEALISWSMGEGFWVGVPRQRNPTNVLGSDMNYESVDSKSRTWGTLMSGNTLDVKKGSVSIEPLRSKLWTFWN